MSKNDIEETREITEKRIDKTPEKQINTYDDLGKSRDSLKIETYDYMKRSDKEKTIKTYDELLRSKEGVPQIRKNDVQDMTEQQKADHAAEGIRGHEWMNPEKWKNLNKDERRTALDHSGKELGKAYKSPAPPLETMETGNQEEQGEYGDGYSYDSRTKRTVGSNYGIRMNENAVTNKNEKLFGDDPRAALETYSHEFRHSYQYEQANAYEKGFRVENIDQAREWSENLKDYKRPPDTELARTDPERYFKEYDAYRNQPVEKDAREFAEEITSKTYNVKKDVEETS